MQTSLGSDTTRLARVSCLDGSNILEEIARNERCDVGAIMVDEDAHTVFAVAFNFLRREWQAVDPQVQPRLLDLQTLEVTLESMLGSRL